VGIRILNKRRAPIRLGLPSLAFRSTSRPRRLDGHIPKLGTLPSCEASMSHLLPKVTQTQLNECSSQQASHVGCYVLRARDNNNAKPRNNNRQANHRARQARLRQLWNSRRGLLSFPRRKLLVYTRMSQTLWSCGSSRRTSKFIFVPSTVPIDLPDRRRWSSLFGTSIGVDLRQALREEDGFDPCEDGLRSVCWKVGVCSGDNSL
jgi:hypothetical protein